MKAVCPNKIKASTSLERQRFTVIPRTLVFITRDDRILLLRGSPQKRIWADKYNGIGGHVERRKYNDRPYIQHPARVGGRVAAHPRATEAMVAAAFLHDVVEDTPHTLDEVSAEFGTEVARLVAELTNPSKGSKAPRRERKQIDRDHLAVVSVEGIERLEAVEGR